MIAPTVSAALSDLHRQFLTLIVPPVLRYASHRARGQRMDHQEETIAESVAVAWRGFLRLHQLGRGAEALTKSFVHYTVMHSLCDRHVGGRQSASCVMSRITKRNHGTTVESFKTQSAMNDQTLVDRKATPAELACLRIDFDAWHQGLPPRQQQVVGLLMTGEKPGNVARQVGISRARVSELRGIWRRQWEAQAVA